MLGKQNPLTKLKKRHKRKAAGTPPGSLVYTGEHRMVQPLATLVQYNESEMESRHREGELPEADAGVEGVRWYDIRGLHDVSLIEKIGRAFDIHPLALEDILDVQQRPKFEEYDSGVFIIIRALRYEAAANDMQVEQVALYITDNTVFSFQEYESDLFLPVRERLERGRGKIRKRPADYLAYALIDTVVDHYFHILDQMENQVDALEGEILRNPRQNTKSRIHDIKLSTLRFRRTVGPLREAISKFASTEHESVSEETQLFVRDVHDHTVQVMEMVETYRDILNGLYDLYVSEISFKMNNVMQVLTVISTIFIPLTFLVGVYGMNFVYMPELNYRYGYFILWAVMIVIALLLVRYFRRKNWL